MCWLHKSSSNACRTVNKHRLPRTVVPQSYEITLAPDLAEATFYGEVYIDVLVHEPTSEIVLNALELNILGAKITNADGSSFDAAVTLDEKLERASLKVNGRIGKGAWRLYLNFNGRLNDKLRGFYRSTYEDEAGVEQVIASTQFEATDARRAFPCFDEPNFKATFKVSLVVDKDLAAISNGRVVSEREIGNGKKQVDFAPTMKMSTYIVAFVVGKLASTKAINIDGVEVRAWCIPGKEHLTKFGLETASFALRYFCKYFGRPYPGGDKIDLLAIPDFDMGAMENLGCITFRETAMLVDPAQASQGDLEWVANTVAHELAHMWFGNLVTMDWWHGIWLNEAFATFMAYKAVHAWKNHWDIWDKFALSRSSAMRTDSLKSTRPVEFSVDHPDEAKAMFDVLTYEKGCSIMHMLEQFVGEEPFRQGIALYMERHAFGNTDGADLWVALEATTNEPVGKIMSSWIFSPGFPELSVQEADTNGSIVITQKPFKFLADAVDPSLIWQVPLFLRAQTKDGVVEKKVLLKDRETVVYLGEDLKWVIANAGGHSFVRVGYSPVLNATLGFLALPQMSVVERFNFVSDTWAQVRSGACSSREFLRLVQLFLEETDPNVWSCITGPLGHMHDLLQAAEKPQFESMVRDLLSPCYARLGWKAAKKEDAKLSELRARVIHCLAITGNDPEVLEKARAAYTAYKADPKSLDPNLIDTVLGICAHFGDAALYDEMFASFKAAETPQDEQNFLSALADFRQPDLVARTLNHTINPDSIRTQDAPYTLSGLMANEDAARAAWSFIKEHWDKLEEMYPESAWTDMCESVSSLDDPELEADVLAFYAGRNLKSARQAVDQSLEFLRVNVLLRARETQPLAARFACQPAAEIAAGTTTADGGSTSTLKTRPPAQFQ